MRPSLHLRACTHHYTTATTVLDGVTVDLGPGWVGVVGPNGSGKTTLLRLLAGELQPVSGSVTTIADVVITCPQEVGARDAAVEAFAGDWSGRPASLRRRLDLDPVDLERWSTLSPGERKRWQVGAALARDPDVLLLDEPTNHLDDDARSVLVTALRRFDGVGLVVSHDRTLLDTLTTATLRLVGTGATLYAGSYSQAREQWVAQEAADQVAHDRARREQRRLQRVLGDLRHDRQGAERAPRAARRSNPDQPDVREAGRKFAQQKAERKLANRVAQVRSRVERSSQQVATFDLHRDLGGDVTVPVADGAHRWVTRLTGDVHHPGGRLLTDVDVGVRRGQHVRVAGPNGAGKTTLLAALADRAAAPAAVLPQDLDPDETAEMVATTRALDPARRGRLLGIVASLGVDPDRLLVSDRLSPGQARKLALAHLLLDPADLLVLDEPTNHLDLPSIERLEQAVAAFPGALLLVTHDEVFAGAVTSTTWQVADGRVTPRWPLGQGPPA